MKHYDMKLLRWISLIVLLAGVGSPPALWAAPEFTYLGDLPGGSEYSVALGVSPDGTYVVGGASSAASGPVSQFVHRTEAFVWDKNRGMVPLGDLPGGEFDSIASGVTNDGNTVVGTSQEMWTPTTRYGAYIWSRANGMARLGYYGDHQRLDSGGSATAILGNGSRVIGSMWFLYFGGGGFGDTFASRGFYWDAGNPLATTTALTTAANNYDPAPSTAGAMNSSGTIVGAEEDSHWDLAIMFRLSYTGQRELLGQFAEGLVTLPEGVSSNGRLIVGEYFGPWGTDIFGGKYQGPRMGAFIWQEGRTPAFEKLPEPSAPPQGAGGVRITANGRVILGVSGRLYLDKEGPYDLRQILLEMGVDFTSVGPDDFRANAISENGLAIVGSVVVNGVTKAWRLRLTDCDGNGAADELERLAVGGDASRLIADGSEKFAASRETLGYGDMISQYGRPWKYGEDRVPARDLEQPAEFLRASLRLGGCVDGGGVSTAESADRFLIGVGFPAVQELQNFELLLGNEAMSDAIDPTIGLDGIAADDLSNQYAFKGTSGIQDLLDEELALLRGRELPGSPADWLNETLYYPQYTSTGGDQTRVAVYNRLPPNATGAGGTAYRSNYRVTDNYDAAIHFPQGHGDAYGHYLSAIKAGISLLKQGPVGWPEDYLINIAQMLVDEDAGLETLRRIAEAAVARAQSAAQITELIYRRDYHENSEDPRAVQLFVDLDPERAWSMGEWARRGAVGTYLDWAVVGHWSPTDESRIVNRSNLIELKELAGAVVGFQGNLDTAGAGLDPLGLIQNVVPFGIDASGLEPGSGRSHYEQVRDAASRALENARKAFENANQIGQRLRDSDQSLSDFTSKLEDMKVDKDQQLIEIFGFASADDPLDNDLDPTTDDFVESQSRPDLVNFLANSEALAAKGMRPRLSPGQVQLAMSELSVSALRVEQADLALDELDAQIRDHLDRIAFLEQIQVDRIKIISKASNDQIALTRRLEDIEERKKSAGLVGSFVKGVLGAAADNPAGLIDYMGDLVTQSVNDMLGDETAFDIEVERTRVQTWKELELLELEGKVQIEHETSQIKELLRRSPQLLLDRAAAVEVAYQALGRMQQAIARGRSLLKEKQRLEARTEGDQLEARWKDLSFRVFRNAALKNYRAFFDIAARYVVLTARAYAFEFDARSDGEDVLAGIYHERRLGGVSGLNGGLQSVLTRLDGAVTVNNFNRPLETLGERSFSFRRNLLGIGAEDFPNDDLKFRAFLASNIVERLEDIPEVRDLAQVSVDRDYGPAIVIAFSTELDSRNFFGRGPELPFGNSNFSLSRNAKIRSLAIRLDGVDASLGTDPESGSVFVYLLPAGDSVLRENTNKPRIEDELIRPWAVVDQFLPTPPLASTADFSKRSYNPWRSTGQAGGNFLNEIKRQKDCEARIELGQTQRFNTNLAGRSAWNTRWLLIIPGSQWTSGSDPAAIRAKLLQFLYGPQADPEQHVGITDIRLIIQAYSH